MYVTIHVHFHDGETEQQFSNLEAIIKNLTQEIIKGQVQMATALEQLKASVADLGTSISAEIQAVTDKLSAPGGTSDAAIAEVTASLTALKKTVDDETAALTAAPAASTDTPLV